MKMRAVTCAAVVLVALAACGGDHEFYSALETQVAVRNGGSASIDATISDGETDLSFEGVAAGTTSTFQEASFGSLSELTVTVGTQTSTIDLIDGSHNVVNIGADGKVEGVEDFFPPLILARAGDRVGRSRQRRRVAGLAHSAFRNASSAAICCAS